MKKLFTLITCAILLFACNNTTKTAEQEQEIIKSDKAEEWLKNIFKCKNGNGYCFYIDKEKQLCTKRFYEFMIDSEEIYGASNLSEYERKIALIQYKKKWMNIYPLRNEIHAETWLFGRGQDDMENIKEVAIKKISDLKYSVFVDYGDNIKTQSEVTLVVENNHYKIDYCVTEFIGEETSTEAEIVYPKTGNKSIDFLPNNIYEIQYEAEGDLNNDGLADIAIVLKNKESNIAERPMLILLQNKDKSYRLDKVSNFVMPTEYNEHDFQKYNTQSISIEKDVLQINLYGAGGPIGNTFSTFKYVENELILTYIETYNAGAGSWQQLYYDLEKGELTEEITNTMEDDMPSKEKTFKLKKEKHLFENTSPNDIIIAAYKRIDSEW